MKLSVSTLVKNSLSEDYRVVDMLRHHLPLVDEIVVHEGLSTDGTYSGELTHIATMLNFYGNYRVYHADPLRFRMLRMKRLIHRNVPNVEYPGDASSVRLPGQPSAGCGAADAFTCHHFGYVRTFVRAVGDDPGDFVRDRFRRCDYLKADPGAGARP